MGEGPTIKKIPLTQGKFALVDDEDFDWLNNKKWGFCSVGYARHSWREGRKVKEILMHRLILAAKKGEFIDHKNGDCLDNRRENIRICTVKQNSHNKRKQNGCTSKFKGVSVNKNGKWLSHIKINGRSKHIGTFCNEDDAALAYNLCAHTHFGEFARFNMAGG